MSCSDPWTVLQFGHRTGPHWQPESPRDRQLARGVLRGKAADTACPSTCSQIKKVGAKEMNWGRQGGEVGLCCCCYVVVLSRVRVRRCRGTSQVSPLLAATIMTGSSRLFKIQLCIFISNDVMKFFFIVRYVQNEIRLKMYAGKNVQTIRFRQN